LNDLERRNGRVVCVILLNLVALGVYYVKVVDQPSTDFLQRNVIKYKHDGHTVRFAVAELLVRLSYCIVVYCRVAARKSCRRRWQTWKDSWRTWALLHSSSRSSTADTNRLLPVIGQLNVNRFPPIASKHRLC